MTPQEALGVLDAAASSAQLSRQQHVQVQQATMTLHQFLNPKPDTAEKAD